MSDSEHTLSNLLDDMDPNSLSALLNNLLGVEIPKADHENGFENEPEVEEDVEDLPELEPFVLEPADEEIKTVVAESVEEPVEELTEDEDLLDVDSLVFDDEAEEVVEEPSPVVAEIVEVEEPVEVELEELVQNDDEEDTEEPNPVVAEVVEEPAAELVEEDEDDLFELLEEVVEEPSPVVAEIVEVEESVDEDDLFGELEFEDENDLFEPLEDIEEVVEETKTVATEDIIDPNMEFRIRRGTTEDDIRSVIEGSGALKSDRYLLDYALKVLHGESVMNFDIPTEDKDAFVARLALLSKRLTQKVDEQAISHNEGDDKLQQFLNLSDPQGDKDKEKFLENMPPAPPAPDAVMEEQPKKSKRRFFSKK